jgi:hypothetical protein
MKSDKTVTVVSSRSGATVPTPVPQPATELTLPERAPEHLQKSAAESMGFIESVKSSPYYKHVTPFTNEQGHITAVRISPDIPGYEDIADTLKVFMRHNNYRNNDDDGTLFRWVPPPPSGTIVVSLIDTLEALLSPTAEEEGWQIFGNLGDVYAFKQTTMDGQEISVVMFPDRSAIQIRIYLGHHSYDETASLDPVLTRIAELQDLTADTVYNSPDEVWMRASANLGIIIDN